jgi:hypothetical protein
MTGDNWTKEFTTKEFHKKATKVLTDLKKQRYTKDKKYRLVKICDCPLTFKELLI